MINIGLEDSNRREVTQVLYNLVSDEYLLSTKTKNYHWNVTGPDFHVLHGLFGDQYTKLDQLIDRIGERIRALGAHAFGGVTEFPRCTRLQERPGMPSELAMVEDLCDDHEVLLRFLRGALAGNTSLRFDFGTTHFLTGVMQEHEKMAWMLRSVLGKHVHLSAGGRPKGERNRSAGRGRFCSHLETAAETETEVELMKGGPTKPNRTIVSPVAVNEGTNQPPPQRS